MADAGWYNDESDPALARWHDGAGWTEHVVDKAEWLEIGQEPPPPEELFAVEEDSEPVGDGRAIRIWAVAGSAAAVALLLVGGVVLDRDSGDDPPRNARSTGESDSSDRLGADSDRADIPGLGDLSDADPDDADSSDADVDSAGGSGSSTTRGSGSGTTQTSTSSDGVRRTEVSNNTRSNTEPINSGVTSGDEVDVGNRSETTNSTRLDIKNTEPPPEEETTTTTSSSTVPPNTDGLF